jgi:lipid-A-disaccharide synthase
LTRTLFLCAGEASGDVHGANLMKALVKQDPDLRFVGVGGPKMRALGLECWREAETLSVVGLVEVLKNIRFFKRALEELTEKALASGADVFIPIDFPDFNLRLSARVKAKGMKVFYYISPQVWAWRRSRVKVIEQICDLLITLFPFEAQYYDPKKLKVRNIGHPLCDEIPIGSIPVTPKKGEGKLVIMPGSRHSELEHHMPVLAEFFMAAHRRWPELEIHLPCAQTLTHDDLWALCPPELKANMGDKLIVHEPGLSTPVLEHGHAALIASGTSILQGVLANRPMALFYRLNAITYWVGKKLIDLPFVGLANLVAEREVCHELIQDDMSVEKLLEETERLMWDEPTRETMLKDFGEIQQKLGGPGGSERAAQLVLENLEASR